MRRLLVGEAQCRASKARYYLLEEDAENPGAYGVQIELDGEEARELVTIDSCRIDVPTRKIAIAASSKEIPASDDKFYYLFSMKPYEKSLPKDREPMKGQRKSGQVEFYVPRHFAGTESSVLSTPFRIELWST